MYVPGSMAMLGQLWSMVVHVTTYYVGPTLDRCRQTTDGTVPTTINRRWINISKPLVCCFIFILNCFHAENKCSWKI